MHVYSTFDVCTRTRVSCDWCTSHVRVICTHTLPVLCSLGTWHIMPEHPHLVPVNISYSLCTSHMIYVIGYTVLTENFSVATTYNLPTDFIHVVCFSMICVHVLVTCTVFTVHPTCIACTLHRICVHMPCNLCSWRGMGVCPSHPKDGVLQYNWYMDVRIMY